MKFKKVVITGSSVLSPIGITREEFSKNLFNEKSGIVSSSSLFGNDFPIKQVALLPADFFPPIEKNLHADETEISIKHLLNQIVSNDVEYRPFDLIIFAGNSGMPKFSEIADFHNRKSELNWNFLSTDYALEYAISILKEKGQTDFLPENKVCCVNGCITSLTAIGIAFNRIALGLNHRALILNIESRVRVEELFRYNAIGALMKNPCEIGTASRPFSISRGGFVKGEGGGALILESEASAKTQNSKILASILGYSSSSDAWRLTEAREDCLGMIESMEKLFKNSNFDKMNVDYISAHGTSTPKNDLLETKAIKEVFQDNAYNIPISSLKSKIGHLNYACGIVEVIACLEMFEQQVLSPTLNYEFDPLLDLNYVPNVSQKKSINYIVKNSFGFGGANASLLLSRT